MIWLLAFLFALLGAGVGYLLGAAIAGALAPALGIGSFEGAAGYFAAFLGGPIGAVVGLIAGPLLVLRRGGYRGPDLTKAKDLVRRSGTKGMAVLVTDIVGDYNTPIARLLVDVLDSIGYHASLRQLPDSDQTENFLYNPRSDIQVETGGWYADFPLPINFYEIISCAAVQQML